MYSVIPTVTLIYSCFQADFFPAGYGKSMHAMTDPGYSNLMPAPVFFLAPHLMS